MRGSCLSWLMTTSTFLNIEQQRQTIANNQLAAVTRYGNLKSFCCMDTGCPLPFGKLTDSRKGWGWKGPLKVTCPRKQPWVHQSDPLRISWPHYKAIVSATLFFFPPVRALLWASPNFPVATRYGAGLESRDSYTAKQLRCLLLSCWFLQPWLWQLADGVCGH